jgi:hypothetical protein
MTLVHNPPWANHVLASVWSELQAVVPQWMPRFDAVTASETSIIGAIRELGCGSFGCVYQTITAGVVLKITTDDTEAEFATTIAPTLVRPICTEYYKVIPLLDLPDSPYFYLLWREEAMSVGKLHRPLINDYGHQRADEVYELIDIQHRNGQIAYSIMGDGRDELLANRTFVQKLRRGQRVMLESGDMDQALSAWIESVADLAVCDVPYVAELFTGVLEVYNQQQVFFGDLHDGNIGAVWRTEGSDRRSHWVITDPGQVAVVNP